MAPYVEVPVLVASVGGHAQVVVVHHLLKHDIALGLDTISTELVFVNHTRSALCLPAMPPFPFPTRGCSGFLELREERHCSFPTSPRI